MASVVVVLMPLLVGVAVGYGIREYISQRRRAEARQRQGVAWF